MRRCGYGGKFPRTYHARGSVENFRDEVREGRGQIQDENGNHGGSRPCARRGHLGGAQRAALRGLGGRRLRAAFRRYGGRVRRDASEGRGGEVAVDEHRRGPAGMGRLRAHGGGFVYGGRDALRFQAADAFGERPPARRGRDGWADNRARGRDCISRAYLALPMRRNRRSPSLRRAEDALHPDRRRNHTARRVARARAAAFRNSRGEQLFVHLGVVPPLGLLDRCRAGASRQS